jgi:hypothetical protein
MKTKMDLMVVSRLAREASIAVNQKIMQRPYGKGLPRMAYAKPYLRAMANQDYGLEDPVMVVLYALDNLTSWRGEDAPPRESCP